MFPHCVRRWASRVPAYLFTYYTNVRPFWYDLTFFLTLPLRFFYFVFSSPSADLVNLPSVATKQIAMETPVDEHQAKDLRTILELKKDHSSRPLWVVRPQGFSHAKEIERYRRMRVNAVCEDCHLVFEWLDVCDVVTLCCWFLGEVLISGTKVPSGLHILTSFSRNFQLVTTLFWMFGWFLQIGGYIGG